MSGKVSNVPVPLRGCDGCSLCCKVMGIGELQKPADVWCPHCATRRSCAIYESRPEECRIFHCGYLFDARLGPEWKPSNCKFVLVVEPETNRIVAHVDTRRPDAWRREPFLSVLKAWSANAASTGGKVLVVIGDRTYAVLPDREIDLGVVGDDKVIVTAKVQTPNGTRIEMRAVDKNDPRLAQSQGPAGPLARK